MDYNDIRDRIARTLSSLEARYDDNIVEHIKIENFNTQRQIGYHVSFGKDSPEQIINKIFSILYNLSSFKDHLKNYLRNNSLNPQIIEEEINNSIHLQVLIDIVNLEKHGYPLRSYRSERKPIIKNPRQVLVTSSGTEANSVSFFSINMDGSINMGGNHKVSIEAEIWDGDETLLFYIDELIDNSFGKLKNIMERFNIL